jgi:hypothetical protein
MGLKENPIDETKYREMLAAEFPEVPASLDKYVRGLLHCEMGTFARLTEEAIDRGNHWQAEKYFRFLDRVRKTATPEVENAIDVSYLESLAFSEWTEGRYRALKRMPGALRKVLLEIGGREKWA